MLVPWAGATPEDVLLGLLRGRQANLARDVGEREGQVRLRQPLRLPHLPRCQRLLHQARVAILRKPSALLQHQGCPACFFSHGLVKLKQFDRRYAGNLSCPMLCAQALPCRPAEACIVRAECCQQSCAMGVSGFLSVCGKGIESSTSWNV